MKKIILPVVLLVGLLFCISANAQEQYVEGEVLIKFDNEFELFKIENNLSVSDAIKSLEDNPVIQDVEPNYIFTTSAINTNDTHNEKLWGFYNYGQAVNGVVGSEGADVNIDRLWTITQDASDIIVAIVDTGIDLDHSDLIDNIYVNSEEIFGDMIDNDSNGYTDDINGYDFVNVDSVPNDNNGHGTHVSGIISAMANNNKGVVGSSYNAQIMPLKALNVAGSGNSSDISKAINYAVDNGALVINLSIQSSSFSVTTYDAINYARSNDVIVVVAAGNTTGNNDNDVNPTYPCSYDLANIICVGATDQDDVMTNFSHYGEKSVDVFAPGINIYSTYLNDTYAFMNGTSMSSPLVAGVVALIKAYDNSLTYLEIKLALIDSVDVQSALLTKAVSEGRIDAYQAMQSLPTPDAIDPTVSFSFKSGTVPHGSILTISADEVSTIYCTTDGSIPSITSPVYTAPFSLVEDITISCLAKDVTGNKSAVVSKTYMVVYKSSIITAAGPGGGPHIRSFDDNGIVETNPDKLFAFETTFRGGVNIAAGDIDGDGVDEIVTGTGEGQEPIIKVFEKDGTKVSEFLAYSSNIQGGVYVACGDLDGNGRDEIITGVPEGFGPHVRVFDGRDGKVAITAGFFAYDKWVRTGIRVASGDLDGDGIDEIVTGTGYGAGTHVRTFTGEGEGIFTPGFFVYETSDRSGINVSVGDVNNDGKEEIMSGSGRGRSPEVKIYTRYGVFLNSFEPYSASYNLGVRIAVGDIDGDGIGEIVTGTVQGGGPQVRAFEYDGSDITSFFAYDEAFRGGVDIAVGNFAGN